MTKTAKTSLIIAGSIIGVVVLGFVFKKFFLKQASGLLNIINQPTGVNITQIPDTRKTELQAIAGQLYDDINGIDWTMGWGKSDVLETKLFPMSDTDLYYVATYYSSTYGEKLSKAIAGDYWGYLSQESQDKAQAVINKLTGWNV